MRNDFIYKSLKLYRKSSNLYRNHLKYGKSFNLYRKSSILYRNHCNYIGHNLIYIGNHRFYLEIIEII